MLNEEEFDIKEFIQILENVKLSKNDIENNLISSEELYIILKDQLKNTSKEEDIILLNSFIEKIAEKLYFQEKNNWQKQGMDLGLERIKKLLKVFNNPQDDLKVIHIGGTNGKGSTSIFIQNILMDSGLKVGLFSSPSIISENESIKINNDFINYSKAYDLLMKIKNTWNNHFYKENYLTYFEAFTVVAILYFKEQNVDIAIFEVGLGGKDDATNVFEKKLASVLTNITIDHLGVIGNSLEEIAYTKSGIIQENDNVFLYPSTKIVTDVIKKVSTEHNAKLNIVNIDDINIEKLESKRNMFSFKNYKNLETSMIGKYQIYNCSLALIVINDLNERKIINVTKENIRNGLLNAKWPGRLEWILEEPRVLIDGAHNEDAMNNLVEFLKNENYNNLRILVGVLKDKEHSKIFEILSKLQGKFYLTEVPFEGRKMNTEDMEKEIREYSNNIETFKIPEDGLNKIFKDYEKDDLIVITGSLYLISKLRKYIVETK